MSQALNKDLQRNVRFYLTPFRDGTAHALWPLRIAKPHTFFSNFAARKEEAQLPPTQRATVRIEAPPTVEHYLHLDPFASSESSNAGSSSSNKVKIAMYDLDGTLIQPKSGARFPKDATDWKWWDPTVKAKLAEVHREQ